MVRTRRGEEAASDPGNDGNELAAAQRGLPRHLQNLVRVASDHGVRLHILPQVGSSLRSPEAGGRRPGLH
eukprot:10225050-Prorocentrum_lima.AAC.1